MWRCPAGDRDRFSLGWALELESEKVKDLETEMAQVKELEKGFELEWWLYRP